ncbi:MAG: transposase [Planctomycetota bacterium]|nr:transposase [Planctomycetota bacterium]
MDRAHGLLCRYITRPPLSNIRLSFAPDGRIVHELRAPFRDGTTHFIFEPLAFIERLAALVPPPRLPQLTYHGVLAPASSWRSDIVPAPHPCRRTSCGGSSPLPLHRYSFAELMKRVFRIGALRCAKCGSERRWIAAITSGEAIAKILDPLELTSAVIRPSPPRAPPQAELEFEEC